MRALLIAADPIRRYSLTSMLTQQQGIEVVAEFARPGDALEYLHGSNADIVFLDLSGDVDAVAFARQLPAGDRTQLALLGDDQHPAIRALGAQVVQRLVHPIHVAMTQMPLNGKIRAPQSLPPANRLTILQPNAAQGPNGSADQKIAFRSKRKVTVLRAQEIRFISAQGNYLKIHARPQVQRFRETISNVERKLDPRTFMRIHRSTIINVQHIREVRLHAGRRRSGAFRWHGAWNQP
jgi:two-component system, LytTR family, response regulator